MKVGMLWYDGDPSRRMDEKVEQAAAYYRRKYGRTPNLCFINPLTAGEDLLANDGSIQIRLSSSVLLNHFWVGVGQEESLEEDNRNPIPIAQAGLI